MGFNVSQGAKEKGRASGTLSAVSGDYAEQRITFGATPVGVAEGNYHGFTAQIESVPAGASVELWLPKVTTSGAASDRTDADYFFAGVSVFPPRVAATPTGITATFGMGNWVVSGYPGAQLRLRSGGVGGAFSFSGSAY